MAWFSRRSTHEKDLKALINLTRQLYEKLTPQMKFERPYARFRFFAFCLSAVQCCCASLMKSNPDAALNEAAYMMVSLALKERSTYIRTTASDQEVATQGAAYLQDFLHRWSAFLEMAPGAAGMNVIATMLREAESSSLPTEADMPRLSKLALDIVQMFQPMRAAFPSAGTW